MHFWKIGNEKIERFAFILLCILMADCCIAGAGRVLTIGPLGFRLALFAVVLVVSLPVIWKNLKEIFRTPMTYMVLAFIGWIVFQTVRGIVNGNDMGIIVTDLKGFAYFAFVPVVLSILNTPKRARTVTKVMMYSSFALSCMIIFTVVSYLWIPSVFETIVHWFAVGEGEHGVAAFTAISERYLRIFFYSGLYLICGCGFSIYGQLTSEKGFRWGYCVITGTCLFALLVTFTRSVYLATFSAAVVLVILLMIHASKVQKKVLGKHIGVSVVLVAAILIFFYVTSGANYMEYALSRVSVTFTDDAYVSANTAPMHTEPTKPSKPAEPTAPSKPHSVDPEIQQYNEVTHLSDKLRERTVAEMMGNIKSSPIIGHGLGLAVKCRSDGYAEYFYLDIISKTGVIGLLLYLSPLLYMLYGVIAGAWKKKAAMPLTVVWLSSLAGFCAYSFFNPYMNAALGILLYCGTMGVYHMEANLNQS